jgi:hypothetical protein
MTRRMSRLLGTIVLLIFAAGSTGCLVHRHPHGSKTKAVVVRERACNPNQYWDGEKCRHKGKGHGARKHDD